MNLLAYYFMLANYSCGTYGSGAYNESCGGGLASTGYDIFIPLAIGLALIVSSIILSLALWLRRRNRRKNIAGLGG